MQERWK